MLEQLKMLDDADWKALLGPQFSVKLRYCQNMKSPELEVHELILDILGRMEFHKAWEPYRIQNIEDMHNLVLMGYEVFC